MVGVTCAITHSMCHSTPHVYSAQDRVGLVVSKVISSDPEKQKKGKHVSLMDSMRGNFLVMPILGL